VLLGGCRTPSPTFAVDDSAMRAATAGSQTAPRVDRSTAPPAAGADHSEPVVQPVTGETLPARESPFARLVGRFSKPRPIPLPRTDLDQPAAEGAMSDGSVDDLAEAF
ncbi:MAG TPA: hypothetical protein VML55_24535, partial [Planctomycetaceae bacterium]|nr:hypothetical protein [Planctomycetaceae bacterium]